MPNAVKPSGAGEQLTIPQVRERQVAMLKALAKHCDDKSIRYYLYKGTLLGAVRHGGWIPWDDDIDVAMPRADFERFCETFPSVNHCNNSGYSLRSEHTDPQYGYPYAKLSDNQTILRTYSQAHTNLGVFVDIFPLDGWRDDKLGILAQRAGYPVLSQLLRIKRLKPSNVTVPAKRVALITGKFALRGIDTRLIARMMTRLATLGDFDRRTTVGDLLWKREHVPSSSFATRSAVTFEDEQYWAPGDTQTVLTRLYGNYLALPPADQRVRRHKFDAFLKTLQPVAPTVPIGSRFQVKRETMNSSAP